MKYIHAKSISLLLGVQLAVFSMVPVALAAISTFESLQQEAEHLLKKEAGVSKALEFLENSNLSQRAGESKTPVASAQQHTGINTHITPFVDAPSGHGRVKLIGDVSRDNVKRILTDGSVSGFSGSSGNSREVIRLFLNHKDLLKLENADMNDFRIVGYVERSNTRSYFIQQYFGGVPVEDAISTMTLTSEGNILAIENRTQTIAANKRAIVSESYAIRKAKNYVYWNNSTDTVHGVSQAYLNGELAYKIVLEASHPQGHWTVFINARDGSLLDYYSALSFADNTLFDTIKIRSDKEHANPDFIMESLAEISRYFTELGAQFNTIPLEVNLNSNRVDKALNGCGSWYDAARHAIEFGGGRCGKDYYEITSDIVFHEFAHSVIYQIYHLKNREGSESGAINEGLADYFAASKNNDPIFGEGAIPFVRNLQNNLRKDTDWRGNIHFDSQIFSGALWDLREAIDTQKADALIFDALSLYPATFEDFLYSLIITDDDDGNLENGTPHQQEILTAFHRHGIGPGIEGYAGTVPALQKNSKGEPCEGEECIMYATKTISNSGCFSHTLDVGHATLGTPQPGQTYTLRLNTDGILETISYTVQAGNTATDIAEAFFLGWSSIMTFIDWLGGSVIISGFPPTAGTCESTLTQFTPDSGINPIFLPLYFSGSEFDIFSEQNPTPPRPSTTGQSTVPVDPDRLAPPEEERAAPEDGDQESPGNNRNRGLIDDDTVVCGGAPLPHECHPSDPIFPVTRNVPGGIEIITCNSECKFVRQTSPPCPPPLAVVQECIGKDNEDPAAPLLGTPVFADGVFHQILCGAPKNTNPNIPPFCQIYGVSWISSGGGDEEDPESGIFTATHGPEFGSLPEEPQIRKYYPTLLATFIDDVGNAIGFARAMFANINNLGLTADSEPDGYDQTLHDDMFIVAPKPRVCEWVPATIITSTNQPMMLHAFVDGDDNGKFQGTYQCPGGPIPEYFLQKNIQSGINATSIMVPGGNRPGPVAYRFFLAEPNAVVNSDGSGNTLTGEIEDYVWNTAGEPLPGGGITIMEPQQRGQQGAGADLPPAEQQPVSESDRGVRETPSPSAAVPEITISFTAPERGSSDFKGYFTSGSRGGDERIAHLSSLQSEIDEVRALQNELDNRRIHRAMPEELLQDELVAPISGETPQSWYERLMKFFIGYWEDIALFFIFGFFLYISIRRILPTGKQIVTGVSETLEKLS